MLVDVTSRLLRSILVGIEGPIVLTNCLNLWFVFCRHFRSIDLVVAFGLLARPGLDGSQLDCGVQSQLVLVLEIEDSAELSGKPGPEVVQEKKLRQV
jgi:hypothetical protein